MNDLESDKIFSLASQATTELKLQPAHRREITILD